MNDHAYLYANTSDKSIMYDLAVHCALVEVLPVPGGGLKRILSSSPTVPAPLQPASPVKWLHDQLLPHPCRSSGHPAAVEVLKFGDTHASLQWLHCNPSRTGAFLPKPLKHPQMKGTGPWVGVQPQMHAVALCCHVLCCSHPACVHHGASAAAAASGLALPRAPVHLQASCQDLRDNCDK